VRQSLPQIPSAAEKAAYVTASSQHKRDNEQGGNIMSDPQTVALVVIAAELGVTADELANDLGPDIHHDSVGVRVITAELAAGLIAADREVKAAQARKAAERDQAQKAARAKSRAETEAMRARLRARGEAQRRILASNPNASAIELMIGADSPALRRINQATDEYLTGHPNKPLSYHPLSERNT
jgi:hypothetical protein